EPETLLSPYPVQNITQLEPGCLRFKMEKADTRTAELINTITKEHQLDSILIARPSLDDVFLFHTGRALRE
ncbi:MAG: hypothetical protein KAH12_05890, partial [Anaerolineales bacterium]|nr:hypothetical protein [Anaerolineales bacterium]